MGYEKFGGFTYRNHSIVILTSKAKDQAPFKYQVMGPYLSTYQEAYSVQNINAWLKRAIDSAITRKKAHK